MPSLPQPLPLQTITELLIKHYDLHEGHYAIAAEFSVAMGMFGPSPEQVVPSGIFGLNRLGLQHANAGDPQAVDAALVNPVKKIRKKTIK